MYMLVYLLFILSTVLFLYIKWKLNYWKRKGVPYMEPDFFFGNTRDLFVKKIHRSQVFKSYYDYFKSRGKKFGGVYTFFAPTLVVTDLELTKNILVKDFDHFINHVGYVNEEADPLSGNLFNLKDHKWRNIRSKLTPTFTTGKMKMMFDTLVKNVDTLQKRLDQYALSKEPVEIKKELLLFTTDIIASVAFGLEVNSMKNPDTEFRKYFNKILEPTFTFIMRYFMTLAVPHCILRKFNFAVSNLDMTKFFTKVVEDVIEYREKNNIYRKDFLHLLIQIKNTGVTTDDDDLSKDSDTKYLTINEITAQCVTFYVAGFETSSTAMTFMLLELALHQDIQDKLREEIINITNKYGTLTYDAINEMQYLDQVFDETLRKDSTSSGISRECTKAYNIPGTDVIIDPGTEILFPVHGLHKDPDYYPDPEKFDPERFSPENKKKIPAFAYIPFGEGPRNCIGLRFAKLQSKVGICAILSRYKVTLGSKTQLPIKLSPNRFPYPIGGVWINLEKI